MQANDKPGFRKEPAKTKTQKIDALEKDMEMFKQIISINQQMIKNLMNNVEDLKTKYLSALNELQYRTIAMVKYLNMDVEGLNKVADQLKAQDFQVSSDSEDIKLGFVPVDTVELDSVVIITSTTPNVSPDAGFFRSKFAVAETRDQALKEMLIGKKVGDEFDFLLNGVEHHLTVLGVRKPPVTEQAEAVPAEPIPVPTAEEVQG